MYDLYVFSDDNNIDMLQLRTTTHLILFCYAPYPAHCPQYVQEMLPFLPQRLEPTIVSVDPLQNNA